MQNQHSIDLAGLFDAVVQSLENDQPYLNRLDSTNGNHGNNMLQNFQIISNALHQNEQLSNQEALVQAANQLQRQGRGQTANLYAQGLLQAAQALQGGRGLTADQLVPFLRGLLSGTQSATQAQPGQGTLLDSLVPGIAGYLTARSQGLNNQQAIVQGLSSALGGSRRVYNQPSPYSNFGNNNNQGWVDPGAASGLSVLNGIFRHIAKI